MTEFILHNEVAIRLSFFIGVLTIMALWEILAPRRALTTSKSWRWISNLSIVFLNSFLVRLLFPVAAVGLAAYAAEHGWGLFNQFQTPFWVAVVVSVVALDLAIYLQHVMFHAVPAFWRLHRMHHADLDFDVTTGARFHPIEIILSMLIKFAVIAVLGLPVVAVIVFEVLLNATAMFNHSNIRLPLILDRLIRRLIVTPDMHRVHHSIEDHETNSNFGFNLSIWDRLFGTYKNQPDAGHEAMTIGIRDFRDPRQVDRLPGMLLLPFRGKVTGYAINRRSWSDKS
ncbi:MAG: fatty acid hydroxylase [Candidatus Muproteobacteria bacterium RBG_16_62_13]|uniref:Fatty acid hydroxylase n=1 Tax=Candidatus Muproteobacteria bacterium RBG_16_62_13 TaxID=1817756 RepID=A0A1F6SYM3_9PROT|nr:MAG: fatty acid hydroxylase [Candidatus Muproteobacteria bacterium RBG_16_62_13]